MNPGGPGRIIVILSVMAHREVVVGLVQEYAKIDKLAATIIEDKQQIVALDERRNKTREALRQTRGEKDAKTWLCLGNTFLKVDSSICESMLNKDKETVEEEITQLRDGLKPKVKQLHKMEGVAEVKGFELKGMTIEDMLNISRAPES